MSDTTGGLGSATGLPAIPTYLSVSRNEQALAKKFGTTDARTKADLAYLQTNAPKLGTVDAFMKNYRTLGIVLESFNMTSEIAYPGLIRQLITQDPTSATSTAKKIGNADYLRFATAMAGYKTNPFASAANITAISNALVMNRYEASKATQAPGLQDALAFKRQAAQVTTVAQLMTNTSMLKVAVAQTGIDYATFGVMDYDRQVAMLTKKVKLPDLQVPAKVDAMAERYLVAAGQDPTAWGVGTASPTGVVSLFSTSITSDPILAALGAPTYTSTSTGGVLSLFA